MTAARLDRQPWEFRFRLWLIMLAYVIGFFGGYAIDFSVGGRGLPAYITLGRHLGVDGVRIAASIGALFAISGFLIRWWGSSYLTGVVMDSALHADRLTISGPYRYVRNPLYLGSLLQGVAIGGMAPVAGLILIVALLLAIIVRLIKLEEVYLRAIQGQSYLDYCAIVPRLLPRLAPIGAARALERPKPGRGLIVELGALGFAAAITYFAAFLPERDDPTLAALWYSSFFALFLGGFISRRFRAGPHAR